MYISAATYCQVAQLHGNKFLGERLTVTIQGSVEYQTEFSTVSIPIATEAFQLMFTCILFQYTLHSFISLYINTATGTRIHVHVYTCICTFKINVCCAHVLPVVGHFDNSFITEPQALHSDWASIHVST